MNDNVSRLIDALAQSSFQAGILEGQGTGSGSVSIHEAAYALALQGHIASVESERDSYKQAYEQAALDRKNLIEKGIPNLHDRIAELARERDEARSAKTRAEESELACAAELDEARAKVDSIVGAVIRGLTRDCGADHSKAGIEEFRGCTICQREQIAQLTRERDAQNVFETSYRKLLAVRDEKIAELEGVLDKIRRQASDSTEYVLAMINRELREEIRKLRQIGRIDTGSKP